MSRLFRCWFCTACAVVLVGLPGLAVSVTAASRPSPASLAPHAVSLGALPLGFEPNRGQPGAEGVFMARGQGYGIVLTSGAVQLSLAAAVIRMTLLGANPQARAVGQRRLPGTVNYVIGDDSRAWRTGLPTFGQVRFSNVYPGIDMLYDGTAGHLAYDFVVAPGADAGAIRLRLDGTRRVSLDARGNLVLGTAAGDLPQQAPLVYQPRQGGGRTVVAAHYQIAAHDRVRFALAGYDRRRPLVIDPALVYATSIGGISQGIAVDGAGGVYLTGSTSSLRFPTTRGAAQRATGGRKDAFVLKLNPAGTAPIYATYLGGTGDDSGTALAVDVAGNVSITGTTNSPNFPTTAGAVQRRYGGGMGDAFVVTLNASGAGLRYATYLGGTGSDAGHGIALDGTGAASISGTTASTDFPTTAGAPQRRYGGGASDAFVARLNAAGSALLYASYLGGRGADSGQGIALDRAGHAYVTGGAGSPGFPATAESPPLEPAGSGYVATLNAAGSAWNYIRLLRAVTEGTAIAVDQAGNAYVAGYVHNAEEGGTDGTVTKLNAAGIQVFSAVKPFGGQEDASSAGLALALDRTGNLLVLGTTNIPGVPTTAGALHPTFLGFVTVSYAPGQDAFLLVLAPSGATLYATYLDEENEPSGTGGIAVDRAGDAYLTFPSTTATGSVTTTVSRVERVTFSQALPHAPALCAVALVGGPDAGVRLTVGPATNKPAGPLTFAYHAAGFSAHVDTVVCTHLGTPDAREVLSGRIETASGVLFRKDDLVTVSLSTVAGAPRAEVIVTRPPEIPVLDSVQGPSPAADAGSYVTFAGP